MMTRSIVGRFLIVAVLLVSLGVIAQAALIISRQADRTKVAKAATMPAAASPATAASAAAPAPAAAPTAETADASPVRVVYPGPLGDAPPPRKIAEAAPASPSPAAAPAPAAPAAEAATPVQAAAPVPAPAPAKPAPVVLASADAGMQPTADAAAPAVPADAAAPAKGGVNLNSASVDALNRIGGGHIGQTIVKHRPYRSVEDLVKKRVVRRSVYEQIKDQVAAD